MGKLSILSIDQYNQISEMMLQSPELVESFNIKDCQTILEGLSDMLNLEFYEPQLIDKITQRILTIV